MPKPSEEVKFKKSIAMTIIASLKDNNFAISFMDTVT